LETREKENAKKEGKLVHSVENTLVVFFVKDFRIVLRLYPVLADICLLVNA